MQSKFERSPRYDTVAEGRYTIPGKHSDKTQILINERYSLQRKIDVAPIVITHHEGTPNEKSFTVFSIKP